MLQDEIQRNIRSIFEFINEDHTSPDAYLIKNLQHHLTQHITLLNDILKIFIIIMDDLATTNSGEDARISCFPLISEINRKLISLELLFSNLPFNYLSNNDEFLESHYDFATD